jgi:hypothetical protein
MASRAIAIEMMRIEPEHDAVDRRRILRPADDEPERPPSQENEKVGGIRDRIISVSEMLVEDSGDVVDENRDQREATPEIDRVGTSHESQTPGLWRCADSHGSVVSCGGQEDGTSPLRTVPPRTVNLPVRQSHSNTAIWRSTSAFCAKRSDNTRAAAAAHGCWSGDGLASIWVDHSYEKAVQQIKGRFRGGIQDMQLAGTGRRCVRVGDCSG